MQTAIDLQDRAIVTLRKTIPQGRKGAYANDAARVRFSAKMKDLGFGDAAIRQAWIDCWDMADLMNRSEAA